LTAFRKVLDIAEKPIYANLDLFWRSSAELEFAAVTTAAEPANSLNPKRFPFGFDAGYYAH
jgi:hypothetical protein